jgi:hypothetical protein
LPYVGVAKVIDWWAKYDENDFNIKKSNRRRKIDKREKAKEDFMKMNRRGLITDILPLLAKDAKNKGKRK